MCHQHRNYQGISQASDWGNFSKIPGVSSTRQELTLVRTSLQDTAETVCKIPEIFKSVIGLQ